MLCCGMSHPEPLTVEVPEPFADDIRAVVETGEYASVRDVVLDALRHWSGRELDERQVQKLRSAWDAGKASGSAGRVDFDELRVEARRLLAASKARPERAG